MTPSPSPESAAAGCCAEVHVGSEWSRRREACNKPVKHTVAGKGYCGIHNPGRIAARKRIAELQYNVRSAGWARTDAVAKLGEAVLVGGSFDAELAAAKQADNRWLRDVEALQSATPNSTEAPNV